MGFPLKNVGGNNAYPGLNVNECADLCEITTNCLYFEHTGIHCLLKYGTADRPPKNNTEHKIGYKSIAVELVDESQKYVLIGSD